MAVAFIPLDTAYLTAIVPETLFYGASNVHSCSLKHHNISTYRPLLPTARCGWVPRSLPGINLCLFCSYVYVLRFRHTRKITPIVFWVAVLMFLFSTVHVSLGFYRLIRGFIDLRDQPGGPGAYFSDVSTPPNVAKVTIHSVNSILGDSIVVRCPGSLVDF